jgi:hypothetical protein
VSAYEEALVLEPDNKGTKASIAQAKAKITELEKKSAVANSSGEHVRRVPCGAFEDLALIRAAGSMQACTFKKENEVFFYSHYSFILIIYIIVAGNLI